MGFLNSCRITKYDPKDREQGVYTKDEWTSISDVGKVFHQKVFKMDEYEAVEQAYISCIKEIISKANKRKLRIKDFENRSDVRWTNHQILCGDDLNAFVRDCLREKCWGKLHGFRFYIHFGYDYYMYVGSSLPIEVLDSIASKYGLFCETFRSPYT